MFALIIAVYGLFSMDIVNYKRKDIDLLFLFL
jgi:hypothetical protein